VAFEVAGESAAGGEPGQSALDVAAAGITAKPRWSAGLRAISRVVRRTSRVQSTKRRRYGPVGEDVPDRGGHVGAQ